jgi:hypothetical protein
MNKSELKLIVKEIIARVNESVEGLSSIDLDDWHDEERSYYAPKGSTAWDWINEAEQNALNAIEELDI